MENGFNHPSRRPGTRKQTRSPLERSTDGSQWRTLDSSRRSALERYARTIRPITDGAPPIPKLGSLRSDRKHPARAGRAPQEGRRARSQRVLCGWDIRSRQKRGLCVGKTKRQGDQDHGHCRQPWSSFRSSTENASPARVKLVTRTLEERIVEELPERLIGDKAYDSDGLDNQFMQEFGTEMISHTARNAKFQPRMGARCDAKRAAGK